jgi:predicted SAM-dependent methyltransferase
MYKINLGCGTSPTKGWLNFDNSMSVRISNFRVLVFILRLLRIINSSNLNFIDFCRSNKILYANAKKIPLPDDSVSVVYSSHMLEHLDRVDAIKCINEIKRVLIPNGLLRLALPNLLFYIKKYIEEHKSADQLIEELYLSINTPKTLINRIYFCIFGFRHHLWMYDEKSISKFLIENGFRDIKILKPGDTRINDPKPLNLYEREVDSMYIECSK